MALQLGCLGVNVLPNVCGEGVIELARVAGVVGDDSIEAEDDDNADDDDISDITMT